MLRRICITNYALFEHAELELGEGFNVLTGETGAGKSLVVDAINAVVGSRADLSAIRSGASEATISAEFFAPPKSPAAAALRELGIEPEPDGTILITRRLSRSSGSWCRINGQPATVTMLKQLGQRLVDLHGQHEHQSLLRPERHLDYLDDFAGAKVLRLREQFAELYDRRRELIERRDALRASERELRQREDLLRFQVREIDSAQLSPEEEQELEAQRRRLAHAEKLAEATGAALRLLDDDSGAGADASTALRGALAQLEAAAQFDAQLEPVAEELRTALIHVDEAARTLSDYADSLEFDPRALDEIEARLRTIVNLKRKYGDSIAEILEFRERAAAELEQIEHSEEILAELEEEIAGVEREMAALGGKLSEARAAAAKKLRREIEQRLARLGMERARFEVALSSEESAEGIDVGDRRLRSWRRGFDRGEFLISPNPGEELRPLAKIASGGEISRIMLALRCATAAVGQAPVLVFDEVDAGIGGRALDAVGRSLLELSAKFQVICVTHAPQIAALAHHQHLVEKRVARGRTKIAVATLPSEERVRELARMLGDEEAESALRHAEELAQRGKRLRAEVGRGAPG